MSAASATTRERDLRDALRDFVTDSTPCEYGPACDDCRVCRARAVLGGETHEADVAGLPEVSARIERAMELLGIMRLRVDEYGIAQISDDFLVKTMQALVPTDPEGRS